MGVQRDGEIETAPNAIQPSPIREIAGETPRPGRFQAQALCRLRRCERLAECPMEVLDDSSVPVRDSRCVDHKRIIAYEMGVSAFVVYIRLLSGEPLVVLEVSQFTVWGVGTEESSCSPTQRGTPPSTHVVSASSTAGWWNALRGMPHAADLLASRE